MPKPIILVLWATLAAGLAHAGPPVARPIDRDAVDDQGRRPEPRRHAKNPKVNEQVTRWKTFLDAHPNVRPYAQGFFNREHRMAELQANFGEVTVDSRGGHRVALLGARGTIETVVQATPNLVGKTLRMRCTGSGRMNVEVYPLVHPFGPERTLRWTVGVDGSNIEIAPFAHADERIYFYWSGPGPDAAPAVLDTCIIEAR